MQILIAATGWVRLWSFEQEMINYCAASSLIQPKVQVSVVTSVSED